MDSSSNETQQTHQKPIAKNEDSTSTDVFK
jgi:hypothetical protein